MKTRKYGFIPLEIKKGPIIDPTSFYLRRYALIK
jgi:hypothetical protein